MFHTIKKISPLAGKSFLSYGDWCLIFAGRFSIVIDGFFYVKQYMRNSYEEESEDGQCGSGCDGRG